MGLAESFWSRVSPCPNTGCWFWDGDAFMKGYARIIIDGKQTYATHTALALHGRPRPSVKAMACHHCDMPNCVNPDHLYWGTHKTNVQDAITRGRRPADPPGVAVRRLQTHCKNGHEFTPENTRVDRNKTAKGQRQCLACRRMRASERRRRLKGIAI